MRKYWLIVEDTSVKIRAYLKACEILRAEGELSDKVVFFLFSMDDLKHFRKELAPIYICEDVPNLLSECCSDDFTASKDDRVIYRCIRIKDRDSLINSASECTRCDTPLILLLDVELQTEIFDDEFKTEIGGSKCVIQDSESLIYVWGDVDKRQNIDLIGCVTTEYYAKEVADKYPSKGFADLSEVSGNEISRIRKARDIIIEAQIEWERRYGNRGCQIMHALMLAQQLGKLGHIDNFNLLTRIDGENDFPFMQAFIDFRRKRLTYLKSLFYYAGTRAKKYRCAISVLASLLRQCGITCPIDFGNANDEVILPISPGALYLFQVWHVLCLLNDETQGNPVTRIELDKDSSNVIIFKIKFADSIDILLDLYQKDNGGGTVCAFRRLTSTQPKSPYLTNDPFINARLEEAAKLKPIPNDASIRSVMLTEPTLAVGPLSIAGEGKTLIICASTKSN